jgi:hypothetical protein
MRKAAAITMGKIPHAPTFPKLEGYISDSGKKKELENE